MSNLAWLQDLRSDPRIRIRWHVEAFIDGQGLFRGFIKDISNGGTGIFLQQNVKIESAITLRIYMPPSNSTSVHHTVVVSAKVLNSIHDSYESLFRIGVSFTHFYAPADKEHLQKYIKYLIPYQRVK
jgi:c-di-GMP-binding flagellar brake protein YcgR